MTRRSLLLLVLSLGACGTDTGGLPYNPTQPAVPDPPLPVIGQVVATDARGESDPHWLGTIRGGFGNPLKELTTDAPVAEEVAQGFRQALASRGLLASSGRGRYNLDVTVVRMDCDQYHRREANADFRLVLTDRASGREIYQDEVSSHLVNGSVVTFNVGIFADPQDLRAIAMQAQDQAIDAALGKPGFLAALQRR
jgi:hypothetical protein